MPDRPRSVLVIDASVAIRVLRREPAWQDAQDAIRRWMAEGRLAVPSVFWLEILNVLARRYRQSTQTIVEALAELDATGIETIELGRPMVLSVLDSVALNGLTAYDATYLALAESMDAQLLTADAALALAAGDRGWLIGGKEIHEMRRTYPARSWADWPGAAKYLQELRARVIAGT